MAGNPLPWFAGNAAAGDILMEEKKMMMQPSKEEYEICEKLKNVQMKRKEKSWKKGDLEHGGKE